MYLRNHSYKAVFYVLYQFHCSVVAEGVTRTVSMNRHGKLKKVEIGGKSARRNWRLSDCVPLTLSFRIYRDYSLCVVHHRR